MTVLTFCASQSSAAELSGEQRASHVLNRLAYGPRPGDIEYVVHIGAERYIDEQLAPSRIPIPESLTQRLKKISITEMPAGELLRQFFEIQKAAKDNPDNKQQKRDLQKDIGEQTAEARLIRAIYSPRQLEEVMVDFWFNHFNVFAGKGMDRVLVSSYERDAIRPYVFGRFRDLLGATAKHPAMLFYLDNWLSVAADYRPPAFAPKNKKSNVSGLNENYARELMELHTLGVDGGYSQRDVTELARVLTGWTFNPREMARGGAQFHFDKTRHDWGSKDWLNRHVEPRGQNEGEWALDVLASHPATARRISYRLAQYFVSDTPPQPLVDRLARRFLDTQGDIASVLKTLFSSSEFWEPANVGNKFKTPYQYVLSAVRATNVLIINMRPLLGTLNQLGMPLYGCQTPDGYKNTEEAWMNPDALTRRINFATVLAAGRLPLSQTVIPDRFQHIDKRQGVRGSHADAARGQGGLAIDAGQLLNTVGPMFSERTRTVVMGAQPGLRSALLIGSPDFMRH
ncbi:MAG: DUF1800 domain-containing protein [Pseudomonadota bacterium]